MLQRVPIWTAWDLTAGRQLRKLSQPDAGRDTGSGVPGAIDIVLAYHMGRPPLARVETAFLQTVAPR